MRRIFLDSIRRSLLILVLVTVLPGIAILFHTSQELESEAVEEVEAYALRQVQAMAAHHERILESARWLLLTLAQTSECKSQDWSKGQALLDKVLGINPAYAGLALVDAQGLVRAAAPPVKALDISGEAYFGLASRTGEFAMGNYMPREDKKGVVIHLAQAVRDEGGQVRAVLVAVFDFGYLGRVFQDSHLPAGSVLTITDAAGMRLTRYPETEKYTWVPDLPRMIERMSGQNTEGTFQETGVDGVRRLYSFKRQELKGGEPTHLMLRLGIPVEHALAESRAVLWRSLSLLGLGAGLALVLAWLLGEFTILRPLDKLAQAAQRLGEGDLGARTGLEHREGELGQLAQALDAMAQSLEQREAETIEAHKDIQRLLREKTDCLDRLARCVAHEVRNPVTTIGGLARRMLNQADENGSAAVYLKKIVDDTQRLERIVREVREYADLPLPCPRTEDLGVLLAQTAEPFRERAEKASVRFATEGAVGKAGAVIAWVDRRLLEKTITVLLANALEAMPKGGSLRLELQRGHEAAIITVADTGTGIAGEDMPYVFDPFFTTKANAVGINLSTVKRIASEHHWDVQVQSQPDQGTTFILTLPLFPAELISAEEDELG